MQFVPRLFDQLVRLRFQVRAQFVQVPLRDGLPFYARAGDLFAWFTTLGALGALAAAGRPR